MKPYFFLLSLFISIWCQGKETICLNMIVKDEEAVIRRCLDSVLPVIDYWVIVDTGSSDETKKIIRDHLKNVPGQLFERPWEGWGKTRTEALKLAQKHGKGDYLLFMDADDILQFEGEAVFPHLEKDLYFMWRGTSSFSYRKPQLVKKELLCRWVGVTHEYLSLDAPYTADTLETVRYITLDGGAAAKDLNAKFRKNVDLLEKGLKEEPGNERYAFYLAESYRDAGEKGKALEWYQNRIKMGGWDEEIFWSKLQSAFLLRDLGLPSSVVIESLIAAHTHRPHRPEPIYYLVDLYLNLGDYPNAYGWLEKWKTIPRPSAKDSLFNVDWIEEYGLLFQRSIAAFYVGQYEESLKSCLELMEIKNLPENWRKQTHSNLQFPLQALQKNQNK